MMGMIWRLVKAFTECFTYREQSSDFNVAAGCVQINNDGDWCRGRCCRYEAADNNTSDDHLKESPHRHMALLAEAAMDVAVALRADLCVCVCVRVECVGARRWVGYPREQGGQDGREERVVLVKGGGGSD